MTDRFLFSILSTTGIISGATTLSFGSSYVVGKYMPRPRPAKYFVKKIAKIDSIEDIKEYEDLQGCTFLFKSKDATPSQASSSASGSTTTTSNSVVGYESLEQFRSKNGSSINDDKIVLSADSQRSKCSHGAAVYIEISKSESESGKAA
ncbi:hypothetical protein MHF_0738 [Mycoplasma haemofelis Ohio2]|uniref:Uncharacterized protein n=1 Tax=Mycoplasma haemofelis (strain Ohio2) TaxID=859194 RepID=F6FIG0_MYCHI|nr:hypothetical protein MHF_0738 [Mycoplasma haemofelis Ohio2]